MNNVLVIGAGKIGSMIAFLLARSGDYQVELADIYPKNPFEKKLKDFAHCRYTPLDATNHAELTFFLKNHPLQGIISSLPFYCNVPIARFARENNLHYFDLTEDVQTTESIAAIAQGAKSAFIPQCGLAPGFISIIANHLMQHFLTLDTVKLRVGALPVNVSNALQYALTWSTEGLINEYGNLCRAIEDGSPMMLLPLEGLEEIKIDGLTYETFNTSGGIGSLARTYAGKVRYLNYKTIRYPGHCSKIKFLMQDLKLNEKREVLKDIFEQAIPKTWQDVVLVYVSVIGTQEGQLVEENYVKKFYPKIIDHQRWSAIQLTTASGICCVVDMVFKAPEKYQGFVRQEQFSYQDLLQNPFGEYFR